MNQPMTIECNIHFSSRKKGRRSLETGPEPQVPRQLGRIPRVARLMALAVRFDEYLRTGQVSSYAELATLGEVTRPRISQIMNLLNLAPDIQEDLLFLPRVERGRDVIHLRQLQPIAVVPDWRKQRVMWQELSAHASCDDK